MADPGSATRDSVRLSEQAGAAVCEVARMLIDRLGLDDDLRARLREDVTMVYERPDRSGFPNRLGADEISLPAQIVQLAEAVTLHLRLVGAEAALAMLRERRGRAFLPDVVDSYLADADPLMTEPDDPWTEVLSMEPGGTPVLGPEGIDDVLTAVADFTDLKSPYTAGHSRSVAALAGAAAVRCGLAGGGVSTVRRAGWIHDVGRITVSVPVWHEPGPFDHDEQEQVRLHPYVTERVFARSPLLRPVAALAGQHHERVDGSGYHRGQRGADLGVPARLLGAADVYAALVTERAHRPAATPREAADVLRAEAKAGRLDADAVDGVLGAAGHAARRRQALVGGLTAREAEVLQLLARGSSNPGIAAALVVSRKTVEHHVEAVYAKLGVHSRSAATLRAMQCGLLSDEPREHGWTSPCARVPLPEGPRRRTRTEEDPMTDVGDRLGVAAWLDVNRSFAVARPDGRHAVSDVVDDGNRFAIEGVRTGTHTGPMAGPAGEIPPTGRSVVLPFCGVATRRGDRITAVTVYLDQMTMLGQLGLLPEPAAAR